MASSSISKAHGPAGIGGDHLLPRGRPPAPNSPRSHKRAPSKAAGRRTAAGCGVEVTELSRPCSECGRQFWSERALFGHMRCHRDRPWRGIVPPPGYTPVAAPPGWESPGTGATHEAELEIAVFLGGQASKRRRKSKWKSEKWRGWVMLLAAAEDAAAAAGARDCGFDLNMPPPEEFCELPDSFGFSSELILL